MSKSEGILTLEEVKRCPGWPGDEVVGSKKVAILECVEDIPCNPCETVCPRGAITVGEPITNLPRIDGEKCNGCGACIAVCPGLAIFLLDMNYSGSQAAISVPYELLPLPNKGDIVKGLNRKGKIVCEASVLSVVQTKKYDRTAVVTVSIAREFSEEVRSIRVQE